jgi:peroxiredoxin
LSDPDKTWARAFGVARLLGLYAARHTVYIGVDGKVLDVDRHVAPRSAGDDLVARLDALGVARV